MTRLYTYTIPNDHGFAPNPFYGVLTLTCCKPRTRKVAQVGDLIAATTAADFAGGRGLLVYAARITDKMTMADYRDWAAADCPGKLPSRGEAVRKDHRRLVGDAMYFQDEAGEWHRDPAGGHEPREMPNDLKGRYTLLSRFPDFAYFGGDPVELPPHLRPVIHFGRNHKGPANDPYVADFEAWFDGLPRGQHNLPAAGPLAPQRVAIKLTRRRAR